MNSEKKKDSYQLAFGADSDDSGNETIYSRGFHSVFTKEKSKDLQRFQVEDSATRFQVEENSVRSQNPSILGVAECIASMNTTLRFLGPLRVRGEIFQWKVGAGGYVYFSLKDASGRDALLQSIIFPRSLSNLSDFEEGTEVILNGLPDIYPKAGKLSLRVQTMELAGE